MENEKISIRKDYYTKLHEECTKFHEVYFLLRGTSWNEKETYSFKGTVKISTQFPVEP
jgi:hypothetical protein